MGNLRHLACAALALAAFAAPLAFGQSALLDGKAFTADSGYKGKAAHEKDDITFANGKLHSSACDPYGYDKGDYKAVQVGDAVQLEATTRSEKYGHNVWKGTVRGNDIEGTFIFYPKPGFFNKNPAPEEHWFKGKLKG